MHPQISYWLTVQEHERALADARLLETRRTRTRGRR